MLLDLVVFYTRILTGLNWGQRRFRTGRVSKRTLEKQFLPWILGSVAILVDCAVPNSILSPCGMRGTGGILLFLLELGDLGYSWSSPGLSLFISKITRWYGSNTNIWWKFWFLSLDCFISRIQPLVQQIWSSFDLISNCKWRAKKEIPEYILVLCIISGSGVTNDSSASNTPRK